MVSQPQSTADEQHRADIQAMFALVAPRYDLMNDLMSMGIHRLWKRRVAKLAGPGRGTAVDLAGGTGDIAVLLTANGWQTTVCDPSEEMMQMGQRRQSSIHAWVSGTGEELPFADDSIDLITISFGLRNMTLPDQALNEAVRVLKPGGRFICLEFSKAAPWLRPFYDWYSDNIIPRLGAAVAGRPEAYKYLVNSIRAFPDQETLKTKMLDAGFETASYENLSFGIAAIHIGDKTQ
ncbi:MAG: bifunctional demethylmenaquinone methyltransferase/2-methoxy-6-polyprenyl-1,4-benzoquinol methylase UbiE [Magnetovibrio sp.]|nr:bifunctional demethylmenaquinone methyltransferase/2-methoxy-6-polyprenyl-1,4-benzoquinol methylase UbiE [Magnetovibrio sp.]